MPAGLTSVHLHRHKNPRHCLIGEFPRPVNDYAAKPYRKRRSISGFDLPGDDLIDKLLAVDVAVAPVQKKVKLKVKYIQC